MPKIYRRDNKLLSASSRRFFTEPLSEIDPVLADVLTRETKRSTEGLSLLAPSMILSNAVKSLLGSAFADHDAEGYLPSLSMGLHPDEFLTVYRESGPSRDNPTGPWGEFVEYLAKSRTASLFASGSSGDNYQVNVQPLSGAIANTAIARAILRTGDTLLSLCSRTAGHFSHGGNRHLTGQEFKVIDVKLSEGAVDLPYDNIEALVHAHVPKVAFIGASSYPRSINWVRLASIMRGVSPRPYLVADIAHFAGLVATGQLDNPLPVADVVSFVWYKTLGGPRSGTIITHDASLARRIDESLFPGLQGSPSLAAIAAIACAAKIAGEGPFRELMMDAVRLAKQLAESLRNRNVKLAYGGTDTHMIILQLDGINTREFVGMLERIGIFCNACRLSSDAASVASTGLRLGLVGLAQRRFHRSKINGLADILVAAIDYSRKGTIDVQAEGLLLERLQTLL